LRERIIGTECEYAPVYHGRTSTDAHQQKEADFLGTHENLAVALMKGVRSRIYPMVGEFLGNGGRLYVDRGGLPEYATPECRNIWDVVAYEMAGDRIVQELAEATWTEGASRKLHIYKNNVDYYQSTYGNHENYLITPQGMGRIERLIPFLVTRQIYAGAGKVMPSSDLKDITLQITQRADFFNSTYSDRTSEIRGIINTRKRELPRQGKNQRLHIIVGDSNMSQYAIALKTGITSLMIRLLEEDALGDGLVLEAPVKALKSISRRYDAPVDVSLLGKAASYSALEIQSIYLEKAQRFYATHGADPDESRLLALWADILEGLRQVKLSASGLEIEDDPADMKRKIDWVLKLWLVGRQRSKGARLRLLRAMDMKYHDLDPSTGLYEHCRSLGLVDQLIDEEAILLARHRPPQNTRARIRGLVIEQTHDKKKLDVQIENWEAIEIRTRPEKQQAIHFFNQMKHRIHALKIRMEDPLKADDPGMLKELERFVGAWG